MRIKNRKISGDTIVEVLLAIAVTSVVLAGAYVAVDRSMKATRSAQERGEAIKVAEAQIERLKYLNFNNSTTDIYQNGPFCITSTLTVRLITDVSNDSDDPGGCRSSERYIASITRDASSGTHQIRVLWKNVSGKNTVSAYPGFDEIKMYYRIYQ
jgi:type II secretory pathway pseudopilin PulG